MSMAVFANNGARYTFQVFQGVIYERCKVWEWEGWAVQEVLRIACKWC